MDSDDEEVPPEGITPEWLFRQAIKARRLIYKPEDIVSCVPIGNTSECVHTNVYHDEREGDTVCVDCGLVVAENALSKREYLVATHTTKHKSVYRRIHHFNERINQWMCQDPPVPNELIAQIKPELLANLPVNKTKIRAVLHKYSGVKYIERWLQIYCRVTGHVVPTPGYMVREAMKQMFILHEAAFEACKPPGRKCIINYNLLFVRMLQLLNLSEHYKYFPMLKSKAKVRHLDGVWQNMCKQMGVAYLPLPSCKTLR